jgi:hypothetical protein
MQGKGGSAHSAEPIPVANGGPWKVARVDDGLLVSFFKRKHGRCQAQTGPSSSHAEGPGWSMHPVQGFGSLKRWGGCPTGDSGQCTHLHTSDGALPVFEHGGAVPDQHVEEEPWPSPQPPSQISRNPAIRVPSRFEGLRLPDSEALGMHYA